MLKVCVLGPDGSGKSSLIPALAKHLRESSLMVAIISSTTALSSRPETTAWREQLVSPDTTATDRFYAALGLYHANMSHFLSKCCAAHVFPDVLIIDRGYSSLVTYNRVPTLTLSFQESLIPYIDVPIYVDAPFDQLSVRLAKRGGTDYQDTDLEFREKIWQQGPADFCSLAKERKDAGLFIMNTDGHFADSLRIMEHSVKTQLRIRGHKL
jgi:thymidylate kinase